jgi:hypothetical protein
MRVERAICELADDRWRNGRVNEQAGSGALFATGNAAKKSA